MDESVKASAVTGKHDEGSVEAEVLSEGDSGASTVLPKKTLMLLINGCISKFSS